MTRPTGSIASSLDMTMQQVAAHTDYSLLETLTPDPDASPTGEDHQPRQVFSGHYVPVRPTPLPDPALVAYSPTLFAELGFDIDLAHSDDFLRVFSGDLDAAPEPMRSHGWATGYALSIYGQEYTQQCPFQTGNGYGDGRAISVLEGCFNGRRWEMQLKGAGRTPYCRGADGRAVLRSSVREFLAQEHMHALGVPTSRSLSLIVSTSQGIQRPWYSANSRATNPDRWVVDRTAISTRVAPSFLRVGQLELFARRARRDEHPRAAVELEQILVHAIDREYRAEIPAALPLGEQLLRLTEAFRDRLTGLVAHWIRVGYCQGNFNSDNCPVGGFTLDYGPFGFMELFDPSYQPWTGGGGHFAFFNQPEAAHQNFHMFWKSVRTWHGFTEAQLESLDALRRGFPEVMREKLDAVWRAKLGLASDDLPLVRRLLTMMQQTPVDYTILFRVLSALPTTLAPLEASFYQSDSVDEAAWTSWLHDWRAALQLDGSTRTPEAVSAQMQAVNPKYILREWLLVPAYTEAAEGDIRRIHELQAVMTRPYEPQDEETDRHYCSRKPLETFGLGGVSHMSCSS
ncbi:MAG TPA: hypothetical protein DFR83_02950 [Deltaproteobacteria bacterium]|nr:hypothetical protein [Deltaproteobacteria bacterium]